MTTRALQDHTFNTKYARYIKDKKRRETYEEAVNRVFDMHQRKFAHCGIEAEIEFAKAAYLEQLVLGSQRALQYGGAAMEKANSKGYNCTVAYCDRPRFFQEALWLLLCGCGVGFSVQKEDIDQLPPFALRGDEEVVHVIEDSIEGWADALGALLSGYFAHSQPFPQYAGKRVVLDYSQVRPKGASLSSGVGKAPGPDPLRRSMEMIEQLCDRVVGPLRPIDAYDIIMHASDAVLAGGVRRSASIALFSPDDTEMATAKTGDWFVTNPQRGRSNNSAVLLRDRTTREQFDTLMKSVKEFGEPGYVWTGTNRMLVNPCEAAFAPKLGRNGLTTMGAISIGDEIWSETGWTTVTNKVMTGVKKVYRYTTSSGSFFGTDTHRIISGGERVEVGEADSIDVLAGPDEDIRATDDQSIIDGLVLGDGSVHKCNNDLVYVILGKDDYDTLKAYQGTYIGDMYGTDTAFKVKTTIEAGELPYTYERYIPKRLLFNKNKVPSVLRGLFTANGECLEKYNRVGLRMTSAQMRDDVQLALSSIGINSYFTTDKPKDIAFSNGTYTCKQSYKVNITGYRNLELFARKVGFIQKYKTEALIKVLEKTKAGRIRTATASRGILSTEYLGEMEVFDITVSSDAHTYWTFGLNVSNCCEIGMQGYTYKDGVRYSGWQFCNLVELNAKAITSKDVFRRAVVAGAILGTLQAAYTDFKYLGWVSEEITRREALLGVSMTGIMDSPKFALDPELQSEMAKLVVKVNETLALKIGINPSARSTAVKPAGTSSCLLGTASGIHPHHARRYFRRVQANKMETPSQYFQLHNPRAVEPSVWNPNGTDVVITFCIETSPEAIISTDVTALGLLDKVKLTQQNWVMSGRVLERCVLPELCHNVSNTISVKPDEWEAVADYIYNNRYFFTGISLLPSGGDMDYPQAPFCAVPTYKEIVDQYGVGALLASGLIVDGLHAFKDDLWAGCATTTGNGRPAANELQAEWVRRAHKFARNYFNNDLREMTYCLKRVHNCKLWEDLHREYQTVDYTLMYEETDETKVSDTVACGGGGCNLV